MPNKNNNTLVNYYKCPQCSHRWLEMWSCGCDSECPACRTRNISPIGSEHVRETFAAFQRREQQSQRAHA